MVGYFVGQAVGRLAQIRPAAEVVAEIVGDCETTLEGVREGRIGLR